MKARDAIFILIVVGILIGAMFIIPMDGLGGIWKTQNVCKLKVTNIMNYNALPYEHVGFKFTELTASNWREIRCGPFTIGEMFLQTIYGTNPLQPLGILPITIDIRWTLENIDTGKEWTKSVSVDIPAITITKDFGMDIIFDKVPAGDYMLTMYSSYTIQGYGNTATWEFTLTEDETGTVFKTSGGPSGEWL